MRSARRAPRLHAVVFGEFCERDGPVARHLFVIDHSRGVPEESVADRWPPELAECLHSLVTRILSADHAIPAAAGSDFDADAYVSSDVFVDHVRWAPWQHEELVAHATCVTLPDLYARGFQRTACVALVCSEEHKLLRVLEWVSVECRALSRRLFHVAFARYLRDLHAAHQAVQQVEAKLELFDALPEREQAEVHPLAQVLTQQVSMNAAALSSMMVKRSRRRANHSRDRVESCGPAVAVAERRSSNDTIPSTAADSASAGLEALSVCHRLITLKGSVALRPLPVLCSARFSHLKDNAKRVLWYFSLESPWITETLVQAAQPLVCPTSHPMGGATVGGLLQHSTTRETPLQFIFRVGDFDAVEPYLYTSPLASQLDVDRRPFTLLDDPALLPKLQQYGKKHIINVAYNALSGVPVIVCGTDEQIVLEAMKMCCMFVPGLLQSTEETLRVGIIPFARAPLYRLTGDELRRFAVIGCPVSAVMDGEIPIFSQACVFHVVAAPREAQARQRATEGRGFLGSDFLTAASRVGSAGGSPSSVADAPRGTGQRLAACRPVTVTFHGAEYTVVSPGASSSSGCRRALSEAAPTGGDKSVPLSAAAPLAAAAAAATSTVYHAATAALAAGSQHVTNVRKGVTTLSDMPLPSASFLAGMQRPWTQGLLTELDDVLSLRATTPHEVLAYSNYARLAVKRILVDYCVLASLVINTVVSVNEADTVLYNDARTSKLGAECTSGVIQRDTWLSSVSVPTSLAVNPLDVQEVLTCHHGHHVPYARDLGVVSAIVRRMAKLMAQNRNRSSVPQIAGMVAARELCEDAMGSM